MSYITGRTTYIAPNTYCNTAYLQSMAPQASHVLLTNSGMQAIVLLMFWGRHRGYSVYHEKTTYIETRLLNYNTEPLNLLDADAEIPANSFIFIDNPNHKGEWFDIKKLSEKAHAVGSYLVVDNSRVTVFYDTALTDGADFVVESFSKYGMGTGLLPSGGLYINKTLDVDWGHFTQFAAAFGVSVTEEESERLVAGLETLPLRMTRITKTATVIHEYLQEAGIEHQYAGKAGIITFPARYVCAVGNMNGVRDWGAYGFAFTSWTHCNDARYTGQEPDWYIRLSIGLEDPDTLLNGVKQAFPKEV